MESSHNTPSLFDVIKQFEKLKVDDYQRTYAWSRDEIFEFFSDLKSCVAADDYHFFGTLIFQVDPQGVAKVVDGQQRLTTVFVFMAALRDAIIALGIDTLPKTSDRKLPIPVLNKTWEFLYLDYDPEKIRFESNRFLSAIFTSSIYPEPSEQREIKDRESALTLSFRKAVKAIREMLRSDLDAFHSAEEKLSRINNFIDALRDRFLTLKVQTTTLSESLEIFLTLNNRGLPLGASDLVRGEILAKLGEGESEQKQSAIHKKVFEEWSDIADNVKEVEVFLRHYLVSTGTEKIQKKKVFDAVVVRLRDDNLASRKLKAQGLWKQLQDASEIYNQIIDPKMGGDTGYFLEMLNGLIKSHRILMLNVLDSELPPNDLAKVVRQLFVLGFRWVMSGGNAQELEDKFQKLGNSYRDNRNVEALTSELATEALKISQESIELYLRDEADEGYVGKAVLHAINRARTPGANEIPMTADLHLEHIAPQTSTDGWKEAIFAGNAAEYDHYDSVISRLGNLTLLDFKLNMSIKQKDFLAKAEKYSGSVIKLSNDLVHEKTWDLESINSRTDYLVHCFNQVFSVQSHSVKILTFSEWKQNL
jgi:uncharacterized protein with ParB-like and HNH nuclease domain